MSTTADWVGRPLTRRDGPRKVTGNAPYSSDVSLPGMLHAVLVTSRIAYGRVEAVHRASVTGMPGVVAVLACDDFPRLAPGPQVIYGWTPPAPLQDDRVLFHGQPVAVVVAETPQQATEAARRLSITYAEEPPRQDPAAGTRQPIPHAPDTTRGHAAEGWATAAVRVEQRYTTAENANNPLGLMGAVAAWDGDRLDVWDSTQWPSLVRSSLATMFGVPLGGVRVRVPFLGGGFGAGLITWHYKVIAVAAARVLQRPVKLMLTRPQMFTQVGHRPPTEQTVRLGATHDGALVSIEHHALVPGAVERPPMAMITVATPKVYACPNVTTTERMVLLHRRYPAAMRGPGEHEGSFAVEVAMDELAGRLGLDPVELRLRNLSAVDPGSGLPWSSSAFEECLRVGAQRFGWARRDPRPGSMRDGDLLVGWGMAAGFYTGYELPTSARITINADGTASLRAAATDIGTGTYTVMAQLGADLLGLPLDRVSAELGDTEMPPSAQSGGSALAVSLAHALGAAAGNLLDRVAALSAGDPGSPLHGATRADLVMRDGGVHRAGKPSAGLSYAELLERHGLMELSAEGQTAAAPDTELGMARAGGFGARFVEVRIDPLLARVRVTRVVSVNDIGRVLNPRLARSQIIGGTVGGIGAALFEEVAADPGTGRVANATFADYVIPTNADVPDIDVVFVGGPDASTPSGVKGAGEISLVGLAPAVANAVSHATGRRIRSLPIHLEDLMEPALPGTSP